MPLFAPWPTGKTGVHDVLATRLEIRGGFTGNYIEPLCFRRKYSGPKTGFSWVRHRTETFYTDSITDLPLLERVGSPIIVNPDPETSVSCEKAGMAGDGFRLRSERAAGAGKSK
jgi:phosphoserine phosphatase